MGEDSTRHPSTRLLAAGEVFVFGAPLTLLAATIGVDLPDFGLPAVLSGAFRLAAFLGAALLAGVPVRLFVMGRRGAELRRLGRRTRDWLRRRRFRPALAGLVTGGAMMLVLSVPYVALYVAWAPVAEGGAAIGDKEAWLEAITRSMVRADLLLLLVRIWLVVVWLVFSIFLFIAGLVLVASREQG